MGADAARLGKRVSVAWVLLPRVFIDVPHILAADRAQAAIRIGRGWDR
jgi:hypothetical protein